MAGALILVIAQVGSMREVFDKISNIDEIRETRMLAGPYDIMAIAEASKLSEITETLIDRIRSIDGVGETVTHIFIE